MKILREQAIKDKIAQEQHKLQQAKDEQERRNKLNKQRELIVK